MKSWRGFSSFEFYFAVSVIGIVVLFGVQRYLQLGEQAKRSAFEILSQNFNTSIYNLHAYWILAQGRSESKNVVPVQGMLIYFSETGWPISAVQGSAASLGDSETAQLNRLAPTVSLTTCKSLWYGLLQNPALLSYEGGDSYGTHPYHLSLTQDRRCRFELVGGMPGSYYFDYSIITGQISLHLPAITKDS